MYIKKVILKNFKFFNHYEVKFNKGLNIITGGHETGKSTIIDAIRFVVDPQYESNTEYINLHGFEHKSSRSSSSSVGYVELYFYSRDDDCNKFIVRRHLSNLDVVKINNRQDMKMHEFYHFLRFNYFLINSFMSSFIDSEVLYKVDHNNALFKNLFILLSEDVNLHHDVRELVLSIQRQLRLKLDKLADYPKYNISKLSDHKTNFFIRCKSFVSINNLNYNLKLRSNQYDSNECELSKLNYLEELNSSFIEIHSLNFDNLDDFIEKMSSEYVSTKYICLTKFTQTISNTLNDLHTKIVDLHGFDMDSMVSYPMQLEAQQQISSYVLNLRRNLKIKDIIVKTIEGDIELLNAIITRKSTISANLVQSIESKLNDFVNTNETILEEMRMIIAVTENNATQSFKRPIEFFLNDRLFYYKMKLILCFDYREAILNGLNFTIENVRDHRLIPVFNCIRFKSEDSIKDFFYECLKPILNWVIIIETDDVRFQMPQLPTKCEVTWMPTRQISIDRNAKLILHEQFHIIWKALDFKSLANMKVLNKNEKKFLKFIFYQQQQIRLYESGVLSGGANENNPSEIINLCDTLQSYYRIGIFREEYKSHKNIFTNPTEMPNELFNYKEHLDTIILIAKNIKNDFKMLLTTTKELQYHKEDLILKSKSLQHFNDGTELEFFIDDFDFTRYKNGMDNIDEITTKINELDDICSSLNYKFNKLFLDVYLPFPDKLAIVSNKELRKQQHYNWIHYVKCLQTEFSDYSEMIDNDISRIYCENLQELLETLKKTFLADENGFSAMIKQHESQLNGMLTRSPFNEALQKFINFVPFQKTVLGEINQAIKTIAKVTHLQLGSDIYTGIKIQIHDQVNKSIEITNKLLENCNQTIKIGFSDFVDNLDKPIVDEYDKMNMLKSFQFFILKKGNHYEKQSTSTDFIREIPTRGDYIIAKFLFILGVSLHNGHRLLTFDDISVMLNKDKGILTHILELQEIYDNQQIIMTCTPDEIDKRDVKALNKFSMETSELGINRIIHLDGTSHSLKK